MRFKGKAQLDSVEGKTNVAGMRWCVDHLKWSGLVLPARLDPRDLVMVHGLSCPVKDVRLVRRKLGLRHRFYAQLVCEGRSYRKAQHKLRLLYVNHVLVVSVKGTSAELYSIDLGSSHAGPGTSAPAEEVYFNARLWSLE